MNSRTNVTTNEKAGCYRLSLWPLWLAFLTGLMTMLPDSAKATETGTLAFETPTAARYSFEGPVGERITANLDNWLLPAPAANPGMIEMFRVRDRMPVPDLVPWAGEFIGKYLIAAVQAKRMVDDPTFDASLRDVITEFISTQEDDGYLGPFRNEERLLGHWDLWGHYHCMLGLMMWYEDTGDEAALTCVVRAADLICKVYLDTERRPIQAGSDEMNLSVIHALGRLYRHTADQRYLRMMHIIEKDWETPPAGDYFRQGLANVPFYKTPRPRWESLHAIQGLVELYRITGDADYRTAFTNLWHSIALNDVHNTGAFSTGEGAVGSPYRPGSIETCCQVAWTCMTMDMLRLTGDSGIADELERGFWNAILAYQHPSGRWCTYDTPMNGKRSASAHSIVFQARPGTPEINCCSVNGPRGLGMLSEWALLTNAAGDLIINYYGPMRADVTLSGGQNVRLTQETEYPKDGRISLAVSPEQPVEFAVQLRIPTWSQAATVRVNGTTLDGLKAGAYFPVKRRWKSGDKVQLDLDTPLHTWVGDEEMAGTISLYRGPLLLAYDQKYNAYDCDQVGTLDYQDVSFQVSKPPAGRFPPIVLLRFDSVDGREMNLCDFASAGAYGTEYLSWIPVINAPPPPFRLREPRDGQRIPAGVSKFTWTGPRRADDRMYRFFVATDETMKNPIIASSDTNRPSHVVREGLETEGTFYWQVIACSNQGTTANLGGPRSFIVDKAIPNPYRAHPSLLEIREDGLVAGSRLDGNGSPVYGYLEEARNLTPVEDRHGRENGAVGFRGNGMLRYRVPEFPVKEYTFVAWIRPEKQPAVHLSQVCSAWCQANDDPLRLVIEGERLFVRIEGSGGACTKGMPVRFGEWMHVAAVKAGPSLRLYVNGEEVHKSPCPADLYTAAEDFALGANPHYGGNEFFFGCMDDFAFYATALDKAAIERIYCEGLSLK